MPRALSGATDPSVPLAATALQAGYGRGPVLQGLDLVVPAGSVTALMGPNGAGKTTFVRAICGRLAPSAGAVRICGRPARDVAGRRQIGLAPQEIALYRSLTIAENLSVFARLAGVPGREVAARVAVVMARTGVAERQDERIDRLSGGWQRRANVAAALVGAPRLLLLDEPTVGVDAPAREELGALIRALAAEGIGILLVTHDFGFAEAAADRIAFLAGGRIVLAGALSELLAARFAGRRMIEFGFPAPPPPAVAGLLVAAGLTGDGTGFRGFIPDGAHALAGLIEVLEAAGAGPQAVALRAPGLSDLYAAAVGEGRP